MKNILYILLFLSTTVSAQWQWKKETDSTKLVNGTHSLFLGGHRMLNYKDTLSGGVIKKYVDAHSGGVGIYIPITDTIASKVITRKKLDSLNYFKRYDTLIATGVTSYTTSNFGANIQSVNNTGAVISSDSATGLSVSIGEGSSSEIAIFNSSIGRVASIYKGGSIESTDSLLGKSLRVQNAYMTNAASNLGKYNLTINPTTKEVYAQELAHAFYGFVDLTTSFSLSSNATWYHVTNAGKDLWTNYEDDYVSISNDTITLGQSAHWEIHYHVVFTGNDGVWFKMRLYNVTKGQVIPIPSASTAGGTNLTSIGNTAYCTNCDSGDKIVLQMIPESNNRTITLIDGSILIKATHGIQ